MRRDNFIDTILQEHHFRDAIFYHVLNARSEAATEGALQESCS